MYLDFETQFPQKPLVRFFLLRFQSKALDLWKKIRFKQQENWSLHQNPENPKLPQSAILLILSIFKLVILWY